MQTGATGDERRCPACGALASDDAEWCGQCFQPLVAAETRPVAASDVTKSTVDASAGGSERAVPSDGPAAIAAASGRPPTWPCPACEHDNPLELDACEVCGTTFASLMRQGEARPDVHPRDAASASLLFPGLGHRKVGRGLDGLARGVLFSVLMAMAATMFAAGVDSPGTFGIFAIFLGGAIAVYLGSAWEAHHIADGGGPLVSSRALLWATVAVILTSVVLLAISVVTAARR